MEFSVYYAEFDRILKKRQPIVEQLSIEDYLATFSAFPPRLNETKKCAQTAKSLNTQGTYSFLSGNYEDAVLMYTYSLCKAPPSSELAALAHADRSAVLFRMKVYEDCLSDIDKALALPYLDDLKSEILSRKKAAAANLKSVKQQTRSKSASTELKCTYGESDKLPGVSKGIDIEYSLEEGRKLVAKMPYKAGDILMVQNPYMGVMDMEPDPTHCHQCLKKSFCLIPCYRCTYVVYCSEKCRTEAYDTYHRVECKIQYTLISACDLNRLLLSCQLRWLNVLTEQGRDLKGFYEDFEEIDKNPDPARLGFTGEQFIGNSRKAFLSFLSDKKVEHDPKALFGAAYIVTLLKNHTNFFKTDDDVPLVAKLLVRLGSAFTVNNCVISYFGTEDTKAVVTYLSIKLANHACINNTVTYVDNNDKVVMRASESIKPGDEIVYNYHDLRLIQDSVNGPIITCQHICDHCHKSSLYLLLKPHIKMDRKFRAKLRKDPYNTDKLWKLLNLVHQQFEPLALPGQLVKVMLLDAHEGRPNPLGTQQTFLSFGIQ